MSKVPPHFLIIGAQRGGTTSLFEYLCRHPGIALPAAKEIHFFDNQFGKGPAWYQAQFPALPAGVISGEASPYYLFHPHAPKRIYAWNPRLKLIALLRNPVDRAYSHFHHEVRLGLETLDFEAALALETERLRGQPERMAADEQWNSFTYQHFSYLARGIYVQQLQAWTAAGFPRDQLLIIPSEELYRAPAQVVRAAWDFLEMPPCPTGTYLPYNEGKYAAMNAQTRQRLRDYFRPFNERLFAELGRDFAWD